jgi:cobaltochelatase CobT
MSRIQFESVIEKIGRILATQYNIEVIFEGSGAYTDGKKIVLPYIEEMSDEMRADINGFLDHEVAHCKFTDFPQIKKVISRFHKELLNATEDARIEREMVAEFPGVALNLDPLNEKLRGKLMEKWTSLPWPIRLILGVRDAMEGREVRIDADTKPYLDAALPLVAKLNAADSTAKMRVVTEEIAKLVKEEMDKEPEDKGEEKDSEKGKGEGSEKGEKSESESGDDSSDKGDGSEGKEEKKDGKKSKGKPSKGKGKPEKRDEKADSMIDEEDSDDGSSEFDKHIRDVHSMIDSEIKKAIKDDEKKPVSESRYEHRKMSSAKHIPSTTRFDKTTDYSGKGDNKEYAALKLEVMKLVSPIKRDLERVLKVKENAKHRSERERGTINARALSKLASAPGYRTPFKDFTKTETNNVAVELLIDESGSMSDKIKTAKMSVIAIAEALKALNIPFEVTGFSSVFCRKMVDYSETLGDTSRFNRTSERLELSVFKSFDSPHISGITHLESKSQNPDGECLAWAAKRLSQRDEKRKILLVFSDGMPLTGDGSHTILAGDLKRKVETIQKSGIEVIGFGIKTKAVEQFYSDFIVIDTVSDLPKVTMKKMAKMIAGVK